MAGDVTIGALNRILAYCLKSITKLNSVTFKGLTSGTTVVLSPAVAGTATITLPGVTGTLATLAGTETLTNKTLTSPTISGAVWSGSIKYCSAPVTKSSSATYSNVTGLSHTVVPGTYRFRCVLPSTVAGGTQGIKYAFHYTTTVLTSIEATSMGYTASAVAVQHTTTTTDVADLFSQAGVVIMTIISGTMVVATGGTIDIQVAQNTSGATNTVALLGGTSEFVQIA